MTRKVLVVDDSGLARRGTRRMLEGAGLRRASRPRTAWRRWSAISSRSPTLVVLDLVMKGMYGLEVLGQAARARSAARA